MIPAQKLISLDEPVIETHGPSRDSLLSPVPLSWKLADTLIVIVLAALSVFGALTGAEQINSRLLVDRDMYDAWFDGDLIDNYKIMAERVVSGTSRHPLVPLVAYPPVKA